jgi:hypothetical protein
MSSIIDHALLNAAKEYAGVPVAAGGVSAAAKEGIVMRRFTKTNTHGFKPLSPAYAKAKRKRGHGAQPILVDSGALKASLHNAKVTLVGKGRVIIRWTVPFYGVFHHFGMGRNPVRSPVNPNAADYAAIVRAAAKHLRRLLQQRRQARKA